MPALAKVLHELLPKGLDMAGQGDMKAHLATYNGVMSLLKWGTVASLILAGIVIWLIAG